MNGHRTYLDLGRRTTPLSPTRIYTPTPKDHRSFSNPLAFAARKLEEAHRTGQ